MGVVILSLTKSFHFYLSEFILKTHWHVPVSLSCWLGQAHLFTHHMSILIEILLPKTDERLTDLTIMRTQPSLCVPKTYLRCK